MLQLLDTTNFSYASFAIPILGCIGLTYRLYSVILPYVQQLPDFDLNDDDGIEEIPLYDADETFDYLETLGVIDLVENPTVIGLFTGYLAFIGNLTAFLNTNFASLDPGTLEGLLYNLRPLMRANELT